MRLWERLVEYRDVAEDIAKYSMVVWLALVGTWVYSLRSFAKAQLLSIQNRQVAVALFSDVKDAESGQRGYLLTHDEAYLPQYLAAVRNARSDMRILMQYLADRPHEQKTIQELSAEISGKLDELEHTIHLGRTNHWDLALEVVRSGDGLHRMERIRDLFDVLAAQERDVIRKQQDGML
jgi:CHASE3 domain sensor protein